MSSYWLCAFNPGTVNFGAAIHKANLQTGKFALGISFQLEYELSAFIFSKSIFPFLCAILLKLFSWIHSLFKDWESRLVQAENVKNNNCHLLSKRPLFLLEGGVPTTIIMPAFKTKDQVFSHIFRWNFSKASELNTALSKSINKDVQDRSFRHFSEDRSFGLFCFFVISAGQHYVIANKLSLQ